MTNTDLTEALERIRLRVEEMEAQEEDGAVTVEFRRRKGAELSVRIQTERVERVKA